MAQAGLADAHQTLIISQQQHRAILEAVAAGASARAEGVAREHSHLAKRNLHAAATREAPLRKVAGGSLIRIGQQRTSPS
jgi:GntR family transcriptional regulator of vanillate catabolism